MRRDDDKRMFTRRSVALGVGAFALSPAGPLIGRARAETYPDRLIRIIVPYPAGSPNDVVGRLLASTLGPALGQPVILDNKPGAGGVLGSRVVATAEPDGYTLLLTDCNNHLLASTFNAALSYDPIKSFAPISAVAQSPWVMVTDAGTPASTLPAFIAYAKAHPGKLNFGFGLATSPQVVGAFFKQATGVDIVSVPYKGGVEAVADMLGGRINLNFGTIATLKPLIESGQLKALAVTSATRSTDLPNVPTMMESGLPELTLSFSVGVFAPAGTSVSTLDRLNAAITTAVTDPQMRSALVRLGFEPNSTKREAFAQMLARDGAKWIPVASKLGVKID